MSVFRSTNPLDWQSLDGIYINESAPPPSIKGVQTNTVLLVGQFERGLQAITQVGSVGEFYQGFGNNDAFSGNIALKNKKFGSLRIVRVIASGAALATGAFASSATTRITFSAKQGKGAYGNNLQIKIEAGSTSGSKYTVHDSSTGAVYPDEVYDNTVISAITSSTFAASNLITAAVNSTAAEPSTCAFTNLTSGSDGSVADTDYQTAIGLTEVEGSCNILFLDAYNSTRNGYLKTTAANTEDKMVICAGAQGDSVSTAVTAAGNLRDTDGRIIYGFPWVQTVINGSLTLTSPASWIAATLSQIAPNIDPAYSRNIQYTAAATSLELSLTRANYITLMNAGISAFEYDADLGGFKLKSGVVTQISDTSKLTIIRRRMADYLANSIASFLKNYQNAPNSKDKRSEVKGAILAFIQQNERDGILPTDDEVTGGNAKVVDVESLNTNASIAAGLFKILYRQRIYSSMRFIVLQAEIGQSVVVTAS